ncbi:MAG TPA: ABC transporter permease [Candidatus Saccharimonadales bacterium]|nr:ABC transporter permease [Candidatus Saccharimonadales bacterium]
MKTSDIARRAGRSLRHAKVRTLLTSMAIAVGAFTLTLSLAAGEGSRQYADKLIGSNINPQALLIVKDKAVVGQDSGQSALREYDPDLTTSTQGQTFKQLTQKDIDKIRENPDLKDVQPAYQPTIRYFGVEGDAKKYTSLVQMYDSTIRSETAAGNLPALGTQIGDGDIVMPEAFADILVKNKVAASKEALIGKKVTLTVAKPAAQPTEAEINQIIATEGPAGLAKLAQGETKDVTYTVRALAKQSSLAFVTGGALMVSDGQARELSEYVTKGTASYQKYMAASALVKDGKTPEDVKAQLEKEGYPTQTAKDLQAFLFTIVNILQGIVIGFGVLALFASVFGIINTMYISVLERTQQIGLMKALGTRRRDIARLFRYEAAWIGFLGGVLGSGLAVILGTLLNPWITKQLSLADDSHILVFQPLPIALLILVLIIIAITAGYLPARRAAKLDPIEALRTE